MESQQDNSIVSDEDVLADIQEIDDWLQEMDELKLLIMEASDKVVATTTAAKNKIQVLERKMRIRRKL